MGNSATFLIVTTGASTSADTPPSPKPLKNRRTSSTFSSRPTLGPGDVLAAAGVDPDPLALLDEEGNLDRHPCLQRGGLRASARGRVALQPGVGLRDRKVDGARRLRAGRSLIDE